MLLNCFHCLQKNNKKEVEIGDELRVQCSSFSSKGVPVMSLVEDK